MLTTLIAVLMISAEPIQVQQNNLQSSSFRELRLNGMDTGEPNLLIQVRTNVLEPPKKSPLNGWLFPHLAAGFARSSVETNFNLRFQVFDQFNSGKSDMAVRMLLRLWDFNRMRLNLDHGYNFHQRAVHVYLAFGGEPGAEQKFMEDPDLLDERNDPVRVNNIYVYAITTLEDPLEFARELAHEYGHAILPPFGNGYEEPESWANGDVGERIYMMWLLEGVKANKIGPDDVMGASLEQLQAFYNKVTLPDLKRVATKGPNFEILKKRNKASFNELLGLSSYLASIMPNKMFGRSLVLPTTAEPESFFKAVTEAANEKAEWEVTVPESLKGLAIWVPLQKGSVEGAKELRREGNWVKIQPTAEKVKIINDPED